MSSDFAYKKDTMSKFEDLAVHVYLTLWYRCEKLKIFNIQDSAAYRRNYRKFDIMHVIQGLEC